MSLQKVSQAEDRGSGGMPGIRELPNKSLQPTERSAAQRLTYMVIANTLNAAKSTLHRAR
ncbi:MAG: hypothetical protein WED00_08985 [Aquisalimonadaceae bacterium]